MNWKSDTPFNVSKSLYQSVRVDIQLHILAATWTDKITRKHTSLYQSLSLDIKLYSLAARWTDKKHAGRRHGTSQGVSTLHHVLTSPWTYTTECHTDTVHPYYIGTLHCIQPAAPRRWFVSVTHSNDGLAKSSRLRGCEVPTTYTSSQTVKESLMCQPDICRCVEVGVRCQQHVSCSKIRAWMNDYL